jgi:hypothetical protein
MDGNGSFAGMGPDEAREFAQRRHEVERTGVCTVRLRGGLIYENRVWFDRSELPEALAR